jgi:hypothetical protein
MHWFQERTLNVPSGGNSVFESVSIYLKFRTKVREAFSNPFYGGVFGSSCVSHLFRSCCPSAVSGLVVAVVVDAVNRKAKRLLAHVGKEVFKDLPSFANHYPSTAVMLETLPIRIGASGMHSSPCNPRLAGLVVDGVAVDKYSLPKQFSIQAITGTAPTRFQVRVSDGLDVSAITRTNACRFFGFSKRRLIGNSNTDDGPSAESFSEKWKLRLKLKVKLSSLIMHNKFKLLCRVLGCWLQRRDFFNMTFWALDVNTL